MTLTFTNFKIPNDFFDLKNQNNSHYEEMLKYQEIMKKGDERTIREDNEAKKIIYEFAKENLYKEKFLNKYNHYFEISLIPKNNFWINASNGKFYFSNIEIINNVINGKVDFDSSDYDYDWLEEFLSTIGVSGKYDYYCYYHDYEYNMEEGDEGNEGRYVVWENGIKTILPFEL